MSAQHPIFRSRRTRRRLSSLAIASSAILIVSLLPPVARADTADSGTAPSTSSGFRTEKDRFPDFDSRRTDPAAKAALRERADDLTSQPTPGVRKLRAELGPQGILDIDPLTATPRNVAKLDGFLTAPRNAPAKTIALGYIAGRPDVFRLSGADLSGLTLRKDYVDIGGTHHLSFTQSVAGVTAFGNGLKVAITKDGKIVNITGSAATGLATATLGAAAVSAEKARALSAAGVGSAVRPATARPTPNGGLTYSNGDSVNPAAFVTIAGVRRAWQTLVWTAGGRLYQQVVDATTGKVLYRQNLTGNDSVDAFENYPRAPYGGRQERREMKPGWLPKNSPRLAGNVGHVYSDENNNDIADKNEETLPSSPGAFHFPLKPFQVAGKPCATYPCTWDQEKIGSWRDNRDQGATNVMYHLGKFHDYLSASPIGFTREAGNFETVDGDGVLGEVFDSAATKDGNPGQLNNANFSTPPDGRSPRMQMYLFNRVRAVDPLLPGFGGNQAGLIYHEYGHGLSNRLVVDANGNATLDGDYGMALGQGWSDWYAMSFLANLGMERDTSAPGELRNSPYVAEGGNWPRSQPMDCPVGAAANMCPRDNASGSGGGYTFGDFNTFDIDQTSEIWSQTLWQLRAAIGAKKAESLITRAMELSPPRPTYLDMRNAILQADVVQYGGRTQPVIWRTFASRGMGFFASARNAIYDSPIENFSQPPPTGTPTGSITGTVTDKDTQRPVAGITVSIGGHESGFPGDYRATTDSAGKYTISDVYPGTYPLISASGPNYQLQTRTGYSVPSRQVVLDWTLPRR